MNANMNSQGENATPSEYPELAVKLGRSPKRNDASTPSKRKENDWMDELYKKHTMSLLTASLRCYGS